MEFEEYVAARGPALLRFAYLLSRDAHTAEDLVQQGLATAYRHWLKVTRADHPDAYVKRIILNTYLGWRRRRSTGEPPLADPPDQRTAPDPADAVEAQDAARQMLDSLPPRSRAILVLRYYEDLSDEAIAELLGISSSTVRATAARALASLRDRDASPTANTRIEDKS